MGEEIKDKINKIKEDVDALPTVGFGDYVLHDHHNDIVDVFKELAELLQSLPKKKTVPQVSVEITKGAMPAELSKTASASPPSVEITKGAMPVELSKTASASPPSVEITKGAMPVEIIKRPQANLTHEETVS